MGGGVGVLSSWFGGGGGSVTDVANPLPPRPMKGGVHPNEFQKLRLLQDGAVPCTEVKTESVSTVRFLSVCIPSNHPCV
jgi:hypothetical protein